MAIDHEWLVRLVMILSSAISAGGRHDTQGPAPNGSSIQVPARPTDSVEDEEQDRKILLPFSDDRSSLGGGEFCLAPSVTSILTVLLKHHQQHSKIVIFQGAFGLWFVSARMY